jgi:hypothetical protein
MEKGVKLVLVSLMVVLVLLMSYFVVKDPIETEKSTLKSPVVTNSGQTELILLGSYKISSGFLYKYKQNNDTIYIVEGNSSRYPISISIK